MQKRIVLPFWLIVVLHAGVLQATMQSYTYSGSLSGWGGIADGLLLTAGGDWSRPNTRLSWTVDNVTTPGKWHYSYTITVPSGDVQCVIIETSDASPGPAFTGANLFSLATDPPDWFNYMQIGTHSRWSNLNLPDDVYGIKLCADRDPISLTISFDSDRAPVWGDFYAMSFLVDDPQGDYRNTLHNWGFTLNDQDPSDPPGDGSLNHHVLVPDSVTIPAPAAVLLCGLGTALTGLLRQRGRL